MINFLRNAANTYFSSISWSSSTASRTADCSVRYMSTFMRAIPVYQPKGKDYWSPLNRVDTRSIEDIDTENWYPIKGRLKLDNGSLITIKVFETKNGGWVSVSDLLENKKDS